MSGNKPVGQDADAELWDAYVDVFRGAEWTIDLTTPCLEYQCWRWDEIGRVHQRLEGQQCEFG